MQVKKKCEGALDQNRNQVACQKQYVKSVIGKLIKVNFGPKNFVYKWHWHSWIQNSSNHRQPRDHRKETEHPPGLKSFPTPNS